MEQKSFNIKRAREEHRIKTVKVELLIESKSQRLNKFILSEVSKVLDNMKKHKLK